MKTIGFSAEARLELLESVVYYDSQQAGLGRRFLDTLCDALERIQRHPEMYRPVDHGCRQCRIPRFPYGIVYRERKDRVEIIAVVHLHREPGYWKGRA